MDPVTVPDYPRGLTFEQVWASIQELKEYQERSARETRELQAKAAQESKEYQARMAQESKEFQEKMARESKESYDKAWRMVKATSKQMGLLNNRIGKLIEHMVGPNLMIKLNAHGFNFTEMSREKEFWGKDRVLAEVDVLLEGGGSVMIVEVKSKPDMDDIHYHIKRMDVLRAYADGQGDRRKYYSAICGVIFAKDIRDYALRCGFYVIEPSGDSFQVVAPEMENQPRVWQPGP